MNLSRSFLAIIVIANCVLACPAVTAGSAAEKKLGRASFPNSCAATVQKEFRQGIALLHSFQYMSAEKAFADVAQHDRQCAMAYWGQAMSLYHPLWDWLSAEDLRKGHEYLAEAARLDAKTERERGYLSAAASLYRDDPALDQTARVVAYSNALADLSEKYPDDDEAASFYALSLLSLPTHEDGGLSNQIKAIAILERLYAAHPDHPGAAHYLIHAADTPQLAPLGLDAARHYAKIAPASPHALHMPSHIFTRLGLWQDSIASNLASISTAEHNTLSHFDNESGDQLHAMTYLVYSYLQSGMDEPARRLIDRVKAVPGASAADIANNEAVLEALYSVETHQWTQAADLAPHEGTYPYATMRTYWARAIGAARGGNVDQARLDIDKLNDARATMVSHLKRMGAQMHMGQTLDLGETAQQLEAGAWLAQAEGKSDEALEKMRAAVTRETSYSVDSWTVPAHEMLADLLLELRQPAQALPAYQAALKEAPGRLDALYGAARASQSIGDHDDARLYYAALAKLSDASFTRKEIQEARSFLAGG